MPKYDGKEIRNTEGFMLRDNMSAYQYHQILQKVQSGELLRLRPGVFAEPIVLADTMLDIDILVPGGNSRRKFLVHFASLFRVNENSYCPNFLR